MAGSAEDFATQLRAHGLRVTSPRVAVYRAVEDLSGHPGADVIAQRARELIGGLSTQAVYDSLNALSRAGLLRRIAPAGSPARYETRVGDDHHHVVCRVCGDAHDVDCVTGAALCLDLGDAGGFLVDEAEVTFWGVCPECQEQPSRD